MRLSGSEPELIERDHLLDVLRATLAQAAGGRGRILVVTGEAGAGKTSVVRAATANRPGRTIWGFCEPFATPRPAGPFRDIAGQVWPVDATENVEITFLPERLLRWLSDESAVLVIEDAQWIDTVSAETLRYLGRRIDTGAGAVIVTARDEDGADSLWSALGDLGPAAGVVRIEVPPLSVDGVRSLTADSGIDAAEAMRLTGGNPFLVGELVAATSDRSGSTLRSSVAARMARLPTAGRRVVELVSVVPGRVPADLLAADWLQVDAGIEHGLLVADGQTVQFRHELVRLTVLDALAPGRRSALHAKALQRWDSRPGTEPSVVAHHAREAGDLRRAYTAERAAAERASQLGSHREAAAHARRAAGDAASVGSNSEHVLALVELAEREYAIGQESAALAAAELAVRLAAVDDPALRSRALRVSSRLARSEQDFLRMAADAVRASDVLGSTAERAAALAHQAVALMVARELTAAVSVARQAIDIAGMVGDVRSEVTAFDALGSALLLLGDRTGAQVLRQTIHLAARDGFDREVGRAYGNLVSASGEARMYAISGAAHDEALRYFLARDLDGLASYAQAWHGRCLFEQADWAGAMAECLAVLGQPERSVGIATLAANTVLARVRARRGEPEVGGPLEAAQEFADLTGALQRLAPVVAARSEYHWLTGRPLPVTTLRTAHEMAASRESPWAMGELAFWLWRAGEPAAFPTNGGEPFRLHADGDHAGAFEAWSALGCRYEAADALADSTDPADLRRALDLFTQLGARPARERVARRLREAGITSIPRGPRPATADDPVGLTAREREVADLLTAGLTDPEIATRLHLSVRTVGHHVSAVLRKTGVRSRRDLRPHS